MRSAKLPRYPHVCVARSLSRNCPRDDANDCFANFLLARTNCGKHALETSNRDHIAAPLVGERQLLPCVTAYRKQTRAALKRGNRGVAERRGSAALVCVCCVTRRSAAGKTMWGELRWLHGPFQVRCVLVAVPPTASLSPALRRAGERARRSGRASVGAACRLAPIRQRSRSAIATYSSRRFQTSVRCGRRVARACRQSRNSAGGRSP